MSKLRKSASFRSRIPIRKNYFKRAQCDEITCDDLIFDLRPNQSFGFEHQQYINPREVIARDLSNFLTSDCPYSTYSSNDESDESEAPHKVNTYI